MNWRSGRQWNTGRRSIYVVGGVLKFQGVSGLAVKERIKVVGLHLAVNDELV